MQDLEQKIAAWRARLSAALPGQEETVRELEEHLRDHIDGQIRRGRSADDAFAQGVARLGAPRALAREFARVETGWFGIWRPALVIYAISAAALLAAGGFWAWAVVEKKMSFSSGVFVLALLGCHLAMVVAGLVGLGVIVTGWRRPLSGGELRAQGRELSRLAAMGGGCGVLALAWGEWWAFNESAVPRWPMSPTETGLVAVMVSLGLLWLVQRRFVADDRVRVLLGLLGATAVGAGGYWGAVTAVPYGWLYISAFLSHGAVALVHVRLKQATAEEPVQVVSG